jgi:hypothetical protein
MQHLAIQDDGAMRLGGVDCWLLDRSSRLHLHGAHALAAGPGSSLSCEGQHEARQIHTYLGALANRFVIVQKAALCRHCCCRDGAASISIDFQYLDYVM